MHCTIKHCWQQWRRAVQHECEHRYGNMRNFRLEEMYQPAQHGILVENKKLSHKGLLPRQVERQVEWGLFARHFAMSMCIEQH